MPQVFPQRPGHPHESDRNLEDEHRKRGLTFLLDYEPYRWHGREQADQNGNDGDDN